MTDYFKYNKKIYCKDTNETVFGYIKYLKTKHWQNIRNQLIVPNKTKCTDCKENKVLLQLHHIHYNSLGKENPYKDLVVICEKCHNIRHLVNFDMAILNKKDKKKSKKPKKNCNNCLYLAPLKFKSSSKHENHTQCFYKYQVDPKEVCEHWKIQRDNKVIFNKKRNKKEKKRENKQKGLHTK